MTRPDLDLTLTVIARCAAELWASAPSKPLESRALAVAHYASQGLTSLGVTALVGLTPPRHAEALLTLLCQCQRHLDHYPLTAAWRGALEWELLTLVEDLTAHLYGHKRAAA